MLRILARLLRVDLEQWRALTRLAIKLDLRSASLSQLARSGESRSTAGQLFAMLWIYVFVGVILGIIVATNKDVFFTGTILITYTMVMVAMLVLIDFGAIVISPDDFAILGYQPVSSQTYFISRLTNVLIYCTLLSLALGIIPTGVFFFTLGFNPFLGFAALLGLLLGGITTALCLVFIYAGILRVIHPNKLKRAVSYIQLAMSFLIYGGYMFLPRMINYKEMGSMTLSKKTWLFLLPSTWFASYLDLARGYWRLTEIIPALLSLAVLASLFVKVRGKLALDYSDRLSSAMAVSEGPKRISRSISRRSWFFAKGESRAVALLVRNQFKYDQKFRLAVLSILPLSALYLLMGLRSGPLADPFVAHGLGSGNSWLVYLAVLMFPLMLNTSLSNSDSYQASWIYYATPADRSRVVLASKDFVFAYFAVPYLVFLGALFLYFWRNPWHVVLHLGMLLLLAHLFLQTVVLLNPVLPFSMPPRKAQRSASLIVIMIFFPIAAIGLLTVLPSLVYPNPLLLAGTMTGFAALSCLLETLLKKRVQTLIEATEYRW